MPFNSKHLMLKILFSTVLAFLSLYGLALADMASPHAIHETQPDGTRIVLHIRGGNAFHWQEDINGYTVVRERGNSGRYVYAKQGADGRLAPTEFEVGKVNPKAKGLKKRTLPSKAVIAQMKADGPAGQTASSVEAGEPETASTFGTLKNLVVLIRFADHTSRTVPSEDDIDILMNALGGHPELAPGGSLRDIYLNNSYGALTINSTVVAWATVSGTEAFYAAGQSGLVSSFHEALREALTIVDLFVDFNEFDQDNNGYIDAITFLHSGYGAEWGGTDAYGTYYTDRIWSHKWVIFGTWVSDENVRVYDYHISPALWGTSGSSIGRVGVIAHETGHFLGLPDLYDTDGSGEGIGSWGLMANSWGGDGSQQPPPLMCSWSKIQLGWVIPGDLYAPGHYDIGYSLDSSLVYKVADGYPEDEYLLIENRKRTNSNNDVMDNIPSGGDGLIIYHIDDKAGYNTEGYPGQTGWPENGSHYRVAVLQSDGAYNLEKGKNRGDTWDSYRSGYINYIGPATTPSTDAYQNGVIIETGHEITDISAAGYSMSFDFNVSQVPTEPPAAPTDLTAAATGHHSIDLSWSDNSDNEEGFTVECYGGTIESWEEIGSLGPNATGYTHDGLNEGTTYTYRVVTWNSAGMSDFSNTASATTTTPTPPTAPSNLTATAVSQTQIDLDWTSGENETGQEVQRSLDGVNFSTIASLDANIVDYLDAGLESETTYTYKIVAINTDGTAESDPAFATTLSPSPQAYAVLENTVFGTVTGDLTATELYDGVTEDISEVRSVPNKNAKSQLEHVWEIGPVTGGAQVILTVVASRTPNDEGDDFEFSFSTNGGLSYTSAFIINSDSLETYFAELPPGTSGTVYLKVQDTDRTKTNFELDTVSVDYIMIESFGEVTLTAPTNLSGEAISSTEISLNWTDASGETGYHVFCSAEGLDWAQVGQLEANSTRFTVDGLAANTDYDFKVCSYNNQSETLCTEPVTIRTLNDDPQEDIVIITLAQYKVKAKQLLVEATSDKQPSAALTLVGYGPMTYNAAEGKYVYQSKANDPGEMVTVTSSLEGFATATVILK